MTKPLKILFLLPFAPDHQGTHGGARATAAIIDMLSEHHRVIALYLAAPGSAPPRQPPKCERLLAVTRDERATVRRSSIQRLLSIVDKLLRGRPDWVVEAWSRAMASEAASVAAEFEPDVVQFEFHVMAQYLSVVRAVCPTAACVVTEHEPGVMADLGHGNSLKLDQRLGALARRRAWKRYERRVLRIADGIIAFTQSDANALSNLLGQRGPPISVIPLRLPGDRPSAPIALAAVQSDFVFVGNFRHPPNVDAARRLVQSIFPMIVRELPKATLSLVGADPPRDLADASSDRLTVTGWVDDPAIYLAGAKVVVVPLRQGGGLRVKMLEACAAGKAIVASPIAIEGLSLKDGDEVVVARTDEEFAASGIRLFTDEEARTRLERASRRWWEEEQDPGRWAAEYHRLYASLGKGG